MEEGVPLVESSPFDVGPTVNKSSTPNPKSQEPCSAGGRKKPGRRDAIKWPRARETAVWQQLDNDLSLILEYSLHGRVEAKLSCMGDILYDECRNRFGELTEKQKNGPRQKGRREKEIKQLFQRRHQLRKQWRKATHEQRQGLNLLWEKVRKNLSSLQRAERICKHRERKEKERSCFFKNPYQYAKHLLEDKKIGRLDISKTELERYFREQYGDPAMSIPLGSPGYVPHPAPPSFSFNSSLPNFSEVEDIVQRARSASAPGPDGVPYKLYKNCPSFLKILWKLLRTAWKTQAIPTEWQRAVTVFITKEQNSSNISQFRSIALLNSERKIFFSVLAKRMTSYLKGNGYIHISFQKASVPGFPGCIEHSAVIWEQIQRANKKKGDVHVVWLDLANAYKSVPHQLIKFSLEFFHVPDCIRSLLAKYFGDLQMQAGNS